MNYPNPVQVAQPHKDDINHVESMLAGFPLRWAFRFARRYNSILNESGRQEANLYLIGRKENIKTHDIGLASDDDEIVSLAKAKAKRYWERLASVVDFETEYHLIAKEIALLGVEAPKLKVNSSYESLCRRFSDSAWWSRKLRNAIGQHVEHEAIKAGFVGFRDSYISNESLGRRRQQNKRNAQTLEWIEAENDSGYKSTLAELSAAGVSNPENRKNELMTRIRGIEEEAKRKGMTCEFLTLTCPSKFHPTSNGRRNPKYDESTPKQAQAYLVNVFAKIRAKLGREDINPVGFRVAEPHKDGCPHWHFMLFVKRSEVKPLRSVFRHYAMEMDGGEAGAYKHRFTAVSIDPNKGSAAGYIAKYIAKNINMSGVEDFENHEGGSAESGLERSVAWAALWNIRQFQEMGNQLISKWRELRRIREAEGLPEVVSVLWRAADAGEYGQFIREALKRDISLIKETEAEKPLYGHGMKPDANGVFSKQVFIKGDLVTGIFNRFGELVTGSIKGVLVDGVEVITRLNKWAFSYKSETGEKVKIGTRKFVLPVFKDVAIKSLKDSKEVKAFKNWLWDFTSPRRFGLKGYPRVAKFSLGVRSATLGLV